MIQIAILLTDITSGEKIGIIDFDPSGMLIMKTFENTVRPFALKHIPDLIMEEPLYKKHAKLLKGRSELPVDILQYEANSCADILNRLEKPLTVGKYTVKAQTVRYSL